MIKFNKYINLVGVEFEGLFTLKFKEKCHKIEGRGMIDTMYRDGSVSIQTREEQDLVPQEVVSTPQKKGELDDLLDFFQEAQESKDYNLNSSTGLHFHVSLKKNYYGYIDNEDFYQEWVKMFKTNYPKIYDDRKNNSYCSEHHESGHFQRTSDRRYSMVNYCYDEHTTVEFRAYGGEYATVKELKNVIQDTLNLIKKFIQNREKNQTRVERTIEIKETEFKVKNLNFDLDINSPNGSGLTRRSGIPTFRAGGAGAGGTGGAGSQIPNQPLQDLGDIGLTTPEFGLSWSPLRDDI